MIHRTRVAQDLETCAALPSWPTPFIPYVTAASDHPASLPARMQSPRLAWGIALAERIRCRVSVVWGFVVEIVCLIYYSFRLVVYCKMIGRGQFAKEPWSVARAVMLTLTFILLASSV